MADDQQKPAAKKADEIPSHADIDLREYSRDSRNSTTKPVPADLFLGDQNPPPGPHSVEILGKPGDGS